MVKQVGVVLSGCGVYDGSEIHEAVITLLALDRYGAKYVCAAPSDEQRDVIDHVRGAPEAGERRSVLKEAARIARGEIKDLSALRASDLDALIFPGGFGAAKNLCNFAVAGAAAEAHPQVVRLVREMLAARKPIGAICIAPAMLAAALRGSGTRATLTIGNDAATAAAIEAMGMQHASCRVEDIVVDAQHKLVSTPAYMLAGRISEAALGIEKLVRAVLELA